MNFNSRKNSWLSNFAPSLIAGKEGGAWVFYPTVEHFFQAMKTLDLQERAQIRAAGAPSKARSLGRNVRLRPDWDNLRNDVMLWALQKKFRSGCALAQRLLATGDVELVHEAPWDGYWGSGRGNRGRNELGRMLMAIRASL